MLSDLLFLDRLQQDPLRAAERADGLQAPLADAVVNRPPGNAEKLSSLINRDAPAKLWLERDTVGFKNCRVHEPPTSAVLNGRGSATRARTRAYRPK